MLITRGLKDFARDLIDPQLLILKMTFFFLLMSVVLLWPQFSIHQGELGLTEYQTGIFSIVSSCITIFAPFLCGFIGDKLGNFKIMMVITTMIAGVSAYLFTLVPSAMVDSTSLNETSDGLSNAYNHSSHKTDRVVDLSLLETTFWTYFAVRVSYGLFQGVGYSLFEAAVMANMQNSNVNYGYQRAWGTLGVIVSSYLGGVLVERTGGYNIIFYMSAGMQVLTSLLMIRVNLEFKVPSTSLTRGIIKYFFNTEVLLFFGAMLAAGMFMGYLETFMYRYLHGLGASSVLISLTVTVGAPFELVLTLVTSYFVKLVGHAPIIMAGLFAYVVRFLGFSFLVNPWWVLPLEILESVANGLLSTAAIMYCTVLFPMETIASFRGVLGAVNFGIGKLLGTAIGSEIRERLGHVITFRIWAAVALACSLIYCIGYIVQKRMNSGKFATKQMPENSKGDVESRTPKGFDNKAWVGDE